MVLDDLPAEICTNILSRVPVKSLVRCTALSKFFYSFITNPNFIAAHLQKSSSDNHLLFRSVSYYGTTDVFMIEPDDDNFCGFEKEGLVMPFKNSGMMGSNVLGSINGVICVVDDLEYEGITFRMWNPSIQKAVLLPKPQYFFYGYDRFHSVSGFGFDQLTNDYKVVRIAHFDGQPFIGWSIPRVEVYSLRSGCWRSLGDGLDYEIRRGYETYTSCFVHGAVHWVAHSLSRQGTNNVILHFNVSSETFGVIDVPNCLKHLEICCGGRTPNLMVKECWGNLGLISMEGKYTDDQIRRTIWVMKEYNVVDSWTKVFNLDGNWWPFSLAPFEFGFRDNGEIIVARGYSYSTQTYGLFCIDQKHGERMIGRQAGKSFYFSTYQESMVLWQEGRSCAMLDEIGNESYRTWR